MAERKDGLGEVVEVGDIVASSAKGSGMMEIGRVEKVHPSGRVIMKYAQKVSIYAWEQGAPTIPRSGFRRTGRYALNTLGHQQAEYEQYDYEVNDYTVVGHRWQWVKTQAADLALMVLVKASTGVTPEGLCGLKGMDYDAETPDRV